MPALRLAARRPSGACRIRASPFDDPQEHRAAFRRREPNLNPRKEPQMPQLNAYLSFDGNCADAMRFYERALGGKLEALIANRDSPMAAELPPGTVERIMHARMVIDGQVLMAGDAMVGQPYETMKGFSLTLTYPTAAEARRVFEQLAEGGRVTMPLQQTFWAETFGAVVDRFGTPWMVNGALVNA